MLSPGGGLVPTRVIPRLSRLALCLDPFGPFQLFLKLPIQSQLFLFIGEIFKE